MPNFGKGSFKPMDQRNQVEIEQKMNPQIKDKIIKGLKSFLGEKEEKWWFVSFLTCLIFANILCITLGAGHLIVNVFFMSVAVLAVIVLYRPMRPKVRKFVDSFEGKVLITTLSLISLLIGRIIADFDIASLIDVPPSVLPRAQDALSLLNTILVWFIIFLALLWLSAFFASFHYLTKSTKVFQLVMVKYFLVWFTLIIIVWVYLDRMVQARISPFEHLIVWSSFIPNDLVRHGDGPPLHYCPLQPKDVWVAFMKEEDRPSSMKEDAVLVATPATPSDTHGSFIFRWGKCGNQGPQKQSYHWA